jgi:hypothetical protein
VRVGPRSFPLRRIETPVSSHVIATQCQDAGLFFKPTDYGLPIDEVLVEYGSIQLFSSSLIHNVLRRQGKEGSAHRSWHFSYIANRRGVAAAAPGGQVHFLPCIVLCELIYDVNLCISRRDSASLVRIDSLEFDRFA